MVEHIDKSGQEQYKANAELVRMLNKAKIGIMSQRNSAFICTILFSLKQSWNTRLPTAGTDGAHLYINPDWFRGLDPKEQIGLLAHEAWHVAFDHITRGEHFEKKNYNIAADHVINLMLLKAGFSLPPGGCHDPQYEGMSTEEIFKLLPPAPADVDQDILEITGTDQDIASKKQAIGQILVKAAQQSKLSGDSAGTIPGDIERALHDILNPKMDWFSLLMKYVSAYDKSDYSFQRPNKRFMPDHYLPGLYGESMGDLGLAFDASGSVSDEEFAAYFGETKYMRETLNPQQTTILEFDTKVNNVFILKQEDSMDDVHFSGGGGTRLQPVFDYYLEHPPTVLIIFSDLECSPITEEPPFPVIWISVGNPGAEVHFGELIHYELKYD